ncbi:MAG TPA: CHAT domain-containing protein [Kofleriaceae bacterium]|nr:CHAT domain-containing protein [Kofleriaceae bacterium]
MTGINEQTQDTTASLSPMARPRRRVVRHVAWAALITALGVKFLCTQRDPDCKTAARMLPSSAAVVVCEREYVRSGDPEAGVVLADQQRRSKNRAVASAIANGLLVTSARGEAYRVLGQIAIDEDRLDAAIAALENARDLHRAAPRHGELARDDQALSHALFARFQYGPALRAIDECLTEAGLAGDREFLGKCHVSAAHVLVKAGSFEGAQQEINLANETAQSDRERAWLEFERGNIYQERERSPLGGASSVLAIAAFKDALRAAERAQLPDLVRAAELNLAYSFAELRQPEESDLHPLDEAERHLAAAGVLDRDNEHVHDRTQIAALIAFRRGDLATASAINERLYAALTNENDRISVCTMQARIALAAGQLDVAERWARRGIEAVDKVVALQSTVELRAWVLSSRRQPHELLFVTLARAGRLDEALAALDGWQGRALLDELALPMGVGPVDLRAAATRFDDLSAWLPAAAMAPLLQTGTSHLSIASVRSTDLLALVIAERGLWRVTSGGGQLDITNLGPIDDFTKQLGPFLANPTDPQLAEQFGHRLVPDAMFRTTSEPLRVLLDGPPLSALPVVALRHGGRALIAARPIVRAPRISELACVPAPEHPRHATVLADADGNLPGARQEAIELASRLGAQALLGNEATSAGVFGAARGDLLHVAVHGDVDASGGYLKLHDRKLHALNISAHRIGPAVVVLASCTSAQASDFELAGSLATAFLAGGSAQVVATLRPVTDPGARELTAAFYAGGGAQDPVRALARAQAGLAATSNPDWPNFAVFGHDLCRTQQ